MGNLETGVAWKLKGKPAIIKQRTGGGQAALVGSMYPQVGEQVVLRDSELCGKVTTGATSDPYVGGNQRYKSVDQGKSQCTTDRGDLVPTDTDNTDNNDDNITEPPVDEGCIRYGIGHIGAADSCGSQAVGGNSGGVYYLVDFQNNPLIIYPGVDPTICFNINVAPEQSYSNANLQTSCPDAGNGPSPHTFDPDNPDDPCPECDTTGPGNQYCCDPCSCLGIEGALFRPACRSDPPNTWDKFQFWYSNGALWIWTFVGRSLTDPDHVLDNKEWNSYTNSMGYVLPGMSSASNGWTMPDGVTGWNIVNAPQVVFGPAPGDGKEDDYDHTKGGDNPRNTNFQECMDNLKGQGMSYDDMKAVCDTAGATDNHPGWTDCMRRLYDQNPSLSEEQLSTMCNEHPNWTSCMINAFYESGGDMTEEELIEECKNTPDNYTYCYPLGQVSSRARDGPYPVYALMFYIGGTSTCPWGWPCIQLWNSEPNSGISNLTVCYNNINTNTTEDSTGGEDTVTDDDNTFSR